MFRLNKFYLCVLGIISVFSFSFIAQANESNLSYGHIVRYVTSYYTAPGFGQRTADGFIKHVQKFYDANKSKFKFSEGSKGHGSLIRLLKFLKAWHKIPNNVRNYKLYDSNVIETIAKMMYADIHDDYYYKSGRVKVGYNDPSAEFALEDEQISLDKYPNSKNKAFWPRVVSKRRLSMYAGNSPIENYNDIMYVLMFGFRHHNPSWFSYWNVVK